MTRILEEYSYYMLNILAQPKSYICASPPTFLPGVPETNVLQIRLNDLLLRQQQVPGQMFLEALNSPISALIIPPNTFYSITIIGTAKTRGTLAFRGCIVQAPLGTPREFLLPVPTDADQNLFARRQSAVKSESGHTKYWGLDSCPQEKDERRLSTLLPSLKKPPQFLQCVVVPEQPLQIRWTSLMHRATLVQVDLMLIMDTPDSSSQELEYSGCKYIASPNEMFCLRVEVANSSLSPLAMALDLMFDPAEQVLLEGVSSNMAIGKLKPDETKAVEVPLCFLCTGRFEIGAEVQITGTLKDSRAGASRICISVREDG
ncbi:hypothetical protein EV702DRAFT_1204406 [Suillus placidus]|uniref:Uncharacterized protein n=1 Tax=Suillus placidus TaxID=48579 RepID=A0A9P6ZH06_9AGAM|nr:hypothetical protein EV702DRAFT_1204406 [Suillus placidus]